jgi:predicted RNA-binding Zn-ribbon protein involved in translation (DUF1610 family)
MGVVRRSDEEDVVTRIRASCPACGEVDLQPADVTLHLVRGDDVEVAEGSCYRFACPDCLELVTKPADERIAQLLQTGGVEVEMDAEVQWRTLHPEFPPQGPKLTPDDLLDFHQLLEGDDWFDQLLSLTP